MRNSALTKMVCSHIQQLNKLQSFKEQHQLCFDELTCREIEVLILTAEGLSGAEIAQNLGINKTTVHNHRASIRDKLCIRVPTDYILYALAFDLISF